MATPRLSFKRLVKALVTLVDVFMTAVLLFVITLIWIVVVGFALRLFGLRTCSPSYLWTTWSMFAVTYAFLAAVCLFRAYGAEPPFVKFCCSHPHFRSLMIWVLNQFEAGGGRVSKTASGAWRILGTMTDRLATLAEHVFMWVAGSFAVLIICVLIGVVLYAIAGALSAPWWAIVIIYLLLTRK
jgi:hypothetical protein